jgi:hypothetical protein
MKQTIHIFLSLLFIGNATLGLAQVKIGGAPGAPHPTAVLELESSNQGLLLPRLNTINILTMPTDPQSKGLMVYNTDSNSVYLFDGNSWRPIQYGSPVAQWLLGGNNGTNPATQFVGTLDSTALNIRTFNRPHISFMPNRLTGLYTNSPSGLLTIESLNRPDGDDDVVINNYIASPGSNYGPSFTIFTRQGTPAAPQNVGSNTYLGGFFQSARIGDLDLIMSGMAAYYKPIPGNMTTSDLRFYTGGIPRMIISPMGRVGIGTGNPGGGLDVTSITTDTTGDDITSIVYNNTFEPSFIAYRNRGDFFNPQPIQVGDRLGELRFDGNLGGSKTALARVSSQYLGGTAAAPRSRLALSVNGPTGNQLVLDSTGFVGLGTELPISALDIVAFNKSDASDDINIRTYNNAAGPALLLYRARTNGSVPANLQNSDFLGILNFSGEVGGSNVGLSSITAFYTGNGTTALSNLSFRTSGNQGMLLNDKGWLTIGNSDQSAGATADIQGSLRYKLTSPFATSYTLTNTDLVVLVNATLGPNTINLPSGADFDGHFIVIKNGKNSSISLSPSGGSVLLCNGGGTGCSSLASQRVIGLVGQYTGTAINWIQVF